MTNHANNFVAFHKYNLSNVNSVFDKVRDRNNTFKNCYKSTILNIKANGTYY